MLAVTIESFAYDQKEVLKGIAFQLEKGQHLAVLGESGCGKSTLLHIIYGLLHLDHGKLQWGQKPLLGPRHNLVPGEDFIKLVAQEFNVMPFISVAENVATHLPRLDLKADAARVDELLQVVALQDISHVKVKNLSGGQKQRVALAKALAKRPELLLLDEPFSHIDTFRKNKMRRNLFKYLKDHSISCITATHDAEEALAYADDLLILKSGVPVSYGKSLEVYNQVSTPYEAAFFGEVNTLPAQLFSSDVEDDSWILFPHQLAFSEEKTSLQVVIKHSYFKGSHYLIQGLWNESEVFFNHSCELHAQSQVFLKRR